MVALGFVVVIALIVLALFVGVPAFIRYWQKTGVQIDATKRDMAITLNHGQMYDFISELETSDRVGGWAVFSSIEQREEAQKLLENYRKELTS